MTPLDIRVLDCCTTPAIHATMPFVVAAPEGWTLLRCRCGKDWAHSSESAASRPDQVAEWFTPLTRVESSGAAKLGPAMDYRSLRTHRRSLRVCEGVATWTTGVPNSRTGPSATPLVNSTPSNPSRQINRFIGEYRFLSNFFPSDVTTETGFTYASVEHAYQAAKATTEEERMAVAAAPNPKKAKHRGSKLTLSSDWHSRKIEVMRAMLNCKFTPGSELAAKLLATGDAELIEGNDWGDEFWGQCNGVGENHLGRLLMEIRDRLRGSKASPDRSV